MSFFEDLADKYEDFIESLEDRGIPNPRVLVPAIAVIVVVAAVAAVWFLAVSPGAAKAELKVTVLDLDGKTVGNASVTVYLDESFVDSTVTAEDGVAIFSVQQDEMYHIEVNAPGFKNATRESTPTMLEISLERTAEAAVGATLSFSVKDQAGVSVSNALVELSYDGGAKTVWTGSDGVASIDLPATPEHATVTVKKDGFASETKDFSKEILFSSETAPLDITLKPDGSPDTTSPTYQGKATLIIDVSSQATGKPVGGASVTLVDAATNSKYATAKTFDDGLASIDNVDYGKSFYVNVEDPSKQNQPYSSSEAFSFTPDSTVAKVSMQPAKTGAIASLSIAVKAKTGEALAASEVFVFDSVTNVFINRVTADDAGIASFADLATNRVYYATAWHEGYLPGYISNVRAGDSKTIALDAEATGNYGVVSASVTSIPTAGTDEVPVENAEVTLFVRGGAKSGRFLGVPPAVTGADGSATLRIPLKVDSQAYNVFAKASKESLAGESDAVQASGDVQLKVVVSQPTARIIVRAKDAVADIALSGASATAKVGGTSVATCTANSNGECALEVPPSDSVEVSAKLAGYLDSVAVVSVASKDRKALSLALYPSARLNAAQARFLGFYDRRGKVLEVAPGSVYAAKFEVVAPAATERVGFYLRVGNGASTEDDSAVIRDWDAAPLQYSGAAYDSTQPCAEDNFTSEGKKWVELVWPRGFQGTRVIAVNVFIKPTAAPGEKLDLNYRAYALQRSMLSLSPSDNDLASGLLAKLSQGANVTRGDLCPAKESKQSVEVSQQVMSCSDEVCYRFWFEDAETKALGADGFAATLGKEILIHYDLYSGTAIDKLGVKSSYLSNVRIEPEIASFAAEGDLEAQANEQASEVSITANRKASGVIRATTVMPSQHAPINIILHPVGKPVVEAVKWISIGGAGAPVVRIIPSQVDVALGAEQRIVTITVSDKDGRAISDASVTIFDFDNSPLEGSEVNVVGDGSAGNGEDGKYRITVSPRKLGMLGVRVVREGFKKLERSNAIEVVPAKWFEVEPASLAAFTDNTKAEKQIITLRSYIDSKASVSYDAKCYFADGSTKSGSSILRIVSPSKIDNSMDRFAEVWVKENVTAKATCEIRFIARISPKQAAEQSVVFDVGTSSPVAYSEEKVKCTPWSAPFVVTLNEYGNFETPALCLQYAGMAITNIEVRGETRFLGSIAASPVFNEGYFYVNAFFGDSRLVDEGAASGRMFLYATLSTGQSQTIPIIVNKGYFGTTVFKEYRFGLPDSVGVVIDPATMKGSGVIKSDKDELLLLQTTETAYCKVKEKVTTSQYGQQGLAAFHLDCDLSREASAVDRSGASSLQDGLSVTVVRAQRAFNVAIKFAFDSAKAARITSALKTKAFELSIYGGLRDSKSLGASDLGDYGKRKHEWDFVDESEFNKLGLSVKQDEIEGKFTVSVDTSDANKAKLKAKLDSTRPLKIWFDGSGYGITTKLDYAGETPDIVLYFKVNGSDSALPKDYVLPGEMLNVSYAVNVSQLVKNFSASFKGSDRGRARLVATGSAFNLTREALQFGREDVNATQFMWNVTYWNGKAFAGLPNGQYKLTLFLENSTGAVLYSKEWGGVVKVGSMPSKEEVPASQQLQGTAGPSSQATGLAERLQHVWVSTQSFEITPGSASQPKTVISADESPKAQLTTADSMFVGVQLCPDSLKEGSADFLIGELDGGSATVILTDENGSEKHVFSDKIILKLNGSDNAARVKNADGKGKEFKLSGVPAGKYYVKINVASKDGVLKASGFWGSRAKPSGDWWIQVAAGPQQGFGQRFQVGVTAKYSKPLWKQAAGFGIAVVSGTLAGLITVYTGGTVAGATLLTITPAVVYGIYLAMPLETPFNTVVADSTDPDGSLSKLGGSLQASGVSRIPVSIAGLSYDVKDLTLLVLDSNGKPACASSTTVEACRSDDDLKEGIVFCKPRGTTQGLKITFDHDDGKFVYVRVEAEQSSYDYRRVCTKNGRVSMFPSELSLVPG
jgi:hypothetical protein